MDQELLVPDICPMYVTDCFSPQPTVLLFLHKLHRVPFFEIVRWHIPRDINLKSPCISQSVFCSNLSHECLSEQMVLRIPSCFLGFIHVTYLVVLCKGNCILWTYFLCSVISALLLVLWSWLCPVHLGWCCCCCCSSRYHYCS